MPVCGRFLSMLHRQQRSILLNKRSRCIPPIPPTFQQRHQQSPKMSDCFDVMYFLDHLGRHTRMGTIPQRILGKPRIPLLFSKAEHMMRWLQHVHLFFLFLGKGATILLNTPEKSKSNPTNNISALRVVSYKVKYCTNQHTGTCGV